MRTIKKIYFFILALSCFTIANALQIELEQKVLLKENRETWNVPGSYSKDVFKRKTFILKVTNMNPIDVVVIFFANVGVEIYSEVISDNITQKKPLIFEYTGKAASNKSNYAALGIKRKYGNDKIDACAFVFDKKSGKFLGQKYTSKNFADSIMKEYKDKMLSAVKSINNNQ